MGCYRAHSYNCWPEGLGANVLRGEPVTANLTILDLIRLAQGGRVPGHNILSRSINVSALDTFRYTCQRKTTLIDNRVNSISISS
jgi:hypothetical protein